MVTFKEDTHEYYNGDKKLISVTQLMRKHGLAPNYDGIPSEILRAKAERGTLIHKEIEAYIKRGEIGFTAELSNFIKFLRNSKYKVNASETILYNDIVAGTADLIFDNGGEYIIADIKTTATLHKEAVSWQLSIYAALQGLPISKGLALHFADNGKLNGTEIPLKSLDEVNRLFDCERRGELYKHELAEVDQKYITQLVEVESFIASIEKQKKAAETEAEEIRAALIASMRKNGITSYETDHIKLTYVAPTTRTAIDTKKLKSELPEIAEKYSKTSTVKESLRIKLKE